MTHKFVLQSVNNRIVIAILLPFAEIQATNIHSLFEKLCIARAGINSGLIAHGK